MLPRTRARKQPALHEVPVCVIHVRDPPACGAGLAATLHHRTAGGVVHILLRLPAGELSHQEQAPAAETTHGAEPRRRRPVRVSQARGRPHPTLREKRAPAGAYRPGLVAMEVRDTVGVEGLRAGDAPLQHGPSHVVGEHVRHPPVLVRRAGAREGPRRVEARDDEVPLRIHAEQAHLVLRIRGVGVRHRPGSGAGGVVSPGPV